MTPEVARSSGVRNHVRFALKWAPLVLVSMLAGMLTQFEPGGSSKSPQM